MKTEKIVNNFLSFIENNKNNDNTNLILDCLKNYHNNFIIIGWSMEHALEKCEGIPNAKPISLFDIDNFSDINMPIFIDTDVMNWLLGKVSYEFDKRDRNNLKNELKILELTNLLEKKQKSLNIIRNILIDVSNMNWLERIFSAPKLIKKVLLIIKSSYEIKSES